MLKKGWFSVDEIAFVLKQAKIGIPITKLIQTVGITEQTYYRCKAKDAGLEVD
jgi:putative transposase